MLPTETVVWISRDGPSHARMAKGSRQIQESQTTTKVQLQTNCQVNFPLELHIAACVIRQHACLRYRNNTNPSLSCAVCWTQHYIVDQTIPVVIKKLIYPLFLFCVFMLRPCRAVKFTSKLFGRALSRRIKATVLYATETGKSEQFSKKLVELLGHAFNAQVNMQ